MISMYATHVHMVPQPHKSARNSHEVVTPTEPFQDLIAEFGFVAPKADIEKSNMTTTVSTPPLSCWHGCKAYLLVIDRRTCYVVWAFLNKDKYPLKATSVALSTLIHCFLMYLVSVAIPVPNYMLLDIHMPVPTLWNLRP